LARVALFCGLRRGELRGLHWTNVDFDNGVIRVERSWDKTNCDGPDLVFAHTTTEGFFASTIRARANKAWKAAGLETITPHEARHFAISYFIAAGLGWKQISTWAGHGDARQTWNRYGHLVPGGSQEAAERLHAYLSPPTVAHDPNNDEIPVNAGVLKYRYRDSKPASER
jgi:integrase